MLQALQYALCVKLAELGLGLQWQFSIVYILHSNNFWMVHTWVYNWNEDSHLAPDIQELLSTCVVHPGVAASIERHEEWRKQSFMAV
jgi:hypothetical protein